ncbi:uncharacterized protein LOC101896367 isoform X1 [Musca domestica]|uniref:RING-type E3 ubiquitin transferase n=2 Tax=Musca domestica TaxID=7370 RepID=A0A1I8MNT7_MUSDO|nr:uncharacterized protein LOC101896367 isoform X1 [Musca domestica]XP_005190088.1 uncharacterized protein LOC101896367 isoform X1 [Musca domestica]XP_019894651.1 uncharacterized protein LOC101896367 isoform X1 [Musca domestica]XP_058987477.1 uncharacterized protein LOC101896367 isoform X1 [Musca domestica]XP_058987478.1 uncharacterized protein LOC101896367 isoform X1 [Musca domestica]
MPCDNTTKNSSDIEHADWSTGTSQPYHVRFGSASSQASQSSGDICRICHCESDPQNPLLTPCYCSGSLKYVHQACLQQWLTASETNSCELCKFPFIMHTKIKPFNEWRSLDISGIERRRLCCSVLFHLAAALCVIWSLCVLIERAAEDVQRGRIEWPFWTKLAVVAVGLTGGIVFMYIQCKAYLHLCHRWKARNRILLIQNAPEKVHPTSPPSPNAQQRNRNSSSCSQTHNVVNAPNVNINIDVNMGNPRPTSSYNYASTVEVNDVEDVADGSDRLPTSPHHMLQHADLDVDSMVSQTSAGLPSRALGKHHHSHHHHHHLVTQQQNNPLNHNSHSQLGQVAVAANIECTQSQHNYDRDFALDDVVSQISSFRPCPQGSGSMTPFHDSIHNVLEHSEDSSRVSVNDLCVGSRQDLSTDGLSTDTGREHAMQLSSFSGSGDHKAPSISSGVSHAVANGLGGFVYKPHTKRYSNSSIFLENRDILNDSVDLDLDSGHYLKHDYGGGGGGGGANCNMLTPPDIDGGDKLEKYLGKDLRRYSDTKLLGSADVEASDPMLVCHPAQQQFNPSQRLATRKRPLIKQHSESAATTVLDMTLPHSPLSPPNIHDIKPPARHMVRHSMHTVDIMGPEDSLPHPMAADLTNGSQPSSASYQQQRQHQQQIDKGRQFFKSLPNLSSSCESLIKK